MLSAKAFVTGAALIALCATAGHGDEAAPIRTAGVDVPAPDVKKKVDPAYPPEAVKQGISGIVIVEVIIDETGHVASAELVRSIPALDAAAVEAVQHWTFEPTEVDGKPVRVRHVLALSFTRRLPEVFRQRGIPELRDGRSPAAPRVVQAPPRVEVVLGVTLATDGSLASVDIQRGEQPWADAVLEAVRTWRFAPGEPGVTLSFRVEAEILAPESSNPRISIHLTGLRRSETLAAAAPQASPTPDEPLAPVPAPTATPAVIAGAPAAPTPVPSLDIAAAGAEVEVISAPRVEPLAPPVRSTLPGSSALEGVLLGAGVPDLVSGRRPVVPPFARIRGTNGAVEVRFSIDATGKTSVHEVTGPDLLKPQADEAVRSWVFRRTSPERLFLAVTFTYEASKASAAVELRN